MVWLLNSTKKKLIFFPTNKIKEQFSNIFKIEHIDFAKDCCLFGLKILTDIPSKNIELTIQIF